MNGETPLAMSPSRPSCGFPEARRNARRFRLSAASSTVASSAPHRRGNSSNPVNNNDCDTGLQYSCDDPSPATALSSTLRQLRIRARRIWHPPHSSRPHRTVGTGKRRSAQVGAMAPTSTRLDARSLTTDLLERVPGRVRPTAPVRASIIPSPPPTAQQSERATRTGLP